MNKILYHIKQGTSNFFLGDFPEVPIKPNVHSSPKDRYEYHMNQLPSYDLKFDKAKEEAINNGEIENINDFKKLLWESDERINNPISLFNWERIILKDGDIFDLPEGVKPVKSKMHEASKNILAKAPSFKFKLVGIDSKEESQEELWNELMEEIEDLGNFHDSIKSGAFIKTLHHKT